MIDRGVALAPARYICADFLFGAGDKGGDVLPDISLLTVRYDHDNVLNERTFCQRSQ